MGLLSKNWPGVALLKPKSRVRSEIRADQLFGSARMLRGWNLSSVFHNRTGTRIPAGDVRAWCMASLSEIAANSARRAHSRDTVDTVRDFRAEFRFCEKWGTEAPPASVS